MVEKSLSLFDGKLLQRIDSIRETNLSCFAHLLMSDGVLGHESIHVPNLALLNDVVSLDHVADNSSHCRPLFFCHSFLF